MSFRKFFEANAETLSLSKKVNPEASFNKPKFLSPSIKKYFNEDKQIIITENLSSQELNKILPKISLPKNKTLLTYVNKDIEVKKDINKRILNIKTEKAAGFTIDIANNIVVFSNGKEFSLDSLTDINSKKGYSIDKDTAMEISNEYLNLNIPSKNKKSVFIKAIREKLGLQEE
jgi:hypothetical protein